MSLLRAFAAPRPAAYRCAARYSTAPPSLTSSSVRAADLAAVEAVTESDSAQPGAEDPLRPAHTSPPSKSKLLKDAAKARRTVPFTPATEPQMPLSPPRYHIARSANRNLPVYTDYKRGGNLHLTTVRKVTGDLQALRDELRSWLAKKDEDVKINTLTQQVIVKGHHKETVADFLSARGF
ncbi:Img2-domain-containing protein [Didymella exigua CBS 183.55]|uniref:Large ribosomal subunit protein mL49 n=1 Tax=Didymella exigua CBS 183.55 TaxID=1150837 RepID=A0A6A5RKJ9_9PLEO|nr:Img2-domain-containing protein [Didymella exigua CBS 183.55]KAF1928925.1 Img2-domain-containing protein [Didymella exigua CBS 183.55]